jgi:lipid-A-disaccharide synthase
MHAAALIEQIKLREPEASFAGFGGDRMAAAGCRLLRHIRNLAFMGFVEVFRHRKEIKDNFRIAREALLAEKPDALILIDYPSFNLKMAEFCRKHLPNTRIYYYVPPKIWAWKSWRVHKIARLCDEVLGIFPFEPAFYAKYGYRCTYVGNPTAERILQRSGLTVKRSNSAAVLQRSGLTIAILPGSRKSEVSHCLPRMLTAARQFEGYTIVVTAAPGLDDSFYTPYLREGETLTRDTYGAVQQASAAIVNSGTATLETALLKCPQVAVYHLMPAFIYPLIRWAQPLMFSISHFTLVNIIAGKEVIKECIANDFTVEKVSRELKRILTDEAYTKNMLASYEHIRSILGDQSAAATAASIITSKPQ